MNAILSILIFITIAVSALDCIAAETITMQVPAGGNDLRYSDPVTLAAGDTATLLYSSNTGTPLQLEVVIGLNTRSLIIYAPSHITYSGPITLPGPATIRAKTSNNNAEIELVTLSVNRANSAENVVPANAVVIPEDASGQFQVILESSTDLLNWTAANPGTYGGSTARRFFRTRIVKQN
ncbi:MAG: hypothetical protein QE570_10265 [Verrucomicrobiota bacterium]|jgi:hypothetical protein|nr:hypothetical protein [Verrucomicrobiota bacterium]